MEEESPGCTCKEPSAHDDVCGIFVPRPHPQHGKQVFVAAIYYRKSCPVHGKEGRDGFSYHEVTGDKP